MINKSSFYLSKSQKSNLNKILVFKTWKMLKDLPSAVTAHVLLRGFDAVWTEITGGHGRPPPSDLLLSPRSSLRIRARQREALRWRTAARRNIPSQGLGIRWCCDCSTSLSLLGGVFYIHYQSVCGVWLIIGPPSLSLSLMMSSSRFSGSFSVSGTLWDTQMLVKEEAAGGGGEPLTWSPPCPPHTRLTGWWMRVSCSWAPGGLPAEPFNECHFLALSGPIVGVMAPNNNI